MLRAGDTVVIDGSPLGVIASIAGATVTLTANAAAAAVANKTGLVDFHDGMSYSELLPKSKALLAAQDYVTAVEGALQRRHSTRAAEGGPRGRADGVRSAARRRIARPSLGPRAGDSAAAFGASRTRAAAAAASCPVQVRRALDTRARLA